MTARAIVISDLHLGPGGQLATFRDQVALAAFFRRIAAEQRTTPTELVLAGDVFDFLQSDGYAGFDAAQGEARLDTILRAPGNMEVIAALAELCGGRGADLTVLSGNHDPELLLGPARDRFERAVGRPGSVLWADDLPPLVPRQGEKWPLWGREIGNDHGKVWITHGDRWDPHNAIDRQAVREAVANGDLVRLPPGSHLVFEVLAKIKPQRQWVDELKPEMPAVLLLLSYLDPAKTSLFLRRHLGVSGALVRGSLLAAVRGGPLFGGEERAAARNAGVGAALTGLLADALLEAPEGEREALLVEVSDVLDGVPHPAEGQLGSHGGVKKLLLRAWLDAIRRSERFQAEDGPDDIPGNAAPMLPPQVVGLVAGHTHGPRWLADRAPAYVNTGTWIPVGALPVGDIAEGIDALEAGRWEAHAPRSYAEVSLGEGPPRITLRRCDGAGAPMAR